MQKKLKRRKMRNNSRSYRVYLLGLIFCLLFAAGGCVAQEERPAESTVSEYSENSSPKEKILGH